MILGKKWRRRGPSCPPIFFWSLKKYIRTFWFCQNKPSPGVLGPLVSCNQLWGIKLIKKKRIRDIFSGKNYQIRHFGRQDLGISILRFFHTYQNYDQIIKIIFKLSEKQKETRNDGTRKFPGGQGLPLDPPVEKGLAN